MPTGDHYFSAAPESEPRLRTLHVTLAGRSVQLTTAGGIFSPDHIDTGTQVLIANAPPAPASGDLLDLGCGWGPIALTLAMQSQDATVWAVDVNERALDLVRRNAAVLGLGNINAVRPEDVPPDVTFASIRSNPPIRVGKIVLHALMTTWLPRLHPGADAWLVVQRNLGSDSLHRWLQQTLPTQYETTRSATAKGYRVLQVHRQQ